MEKKGLIYIDSLTTTSIISIIIIVDCSPENYTIRPGKILSLLIGNSQPALVDCTVYKPIHCSPLQLGTSSYMLSNSEWPSITMSQVQLLRKQSVCLLEQRRLGSFFYLGTVAGRWEKWCWCPNCSKACSTTAFLETLILQLSGFRRCLSLCVLKLLSYPAAVWWVKPVPFLLGEVSTHLGGLCDLSHVKGRNHARRDRCFLNGMSPYAS